MKEELKKLTNQRIQCNHLRLRALNNQNYPKTKFKFKIKLGVKSKIIKVESNLLYLMS